MIASGLRDSAQEQYSGSLGLVRLNVALVAIPFARAHSSALQPWSAKSVTSKFYPVPKCTPPPPHPMTTAFGGIGVVSNEWARDQCPTGLVSTGVKSGVKVTAASTVRGSA